MTRFETILVPVDFSEHSQEALDTAIQIAHLFGSTIHLLHCYHIQTAGVSPYGIVLPSGYYADIRDAAEKRLSESHEKVFNEGIKVESQLSAERIDSVVMPSLDTIACQSLSRFSAASRMSS